MKGEKIQKFPSTAFIDAKGKYHHDPVNAPLAEAEAKGLTGARDTAPREHITAIQGYCPHKKLGGHDCPECQ